jgi:nucleoside-diphosphate-sugar epimerase
MPAPLLVLGCGFLGERIARAGLAEGRAVRALRRSPAKLAALAEAGAEVKFVDAWAPTQLPKALAMRGATVVYAVPPGGSLPPGHNIRAVLQAVYGGGAECFVYFSSSGLYGAMPDDDVWIDEDTPIVQDDVPMRGVISDEEEILRSSFDRLRTVILRIAPVYGGGRGVRARLRKGDYKLLDEGQHAISRIHVDDLVQVVFAAEARAPRGARYLVADDEPTTQRDYAQWLCERMGLPMPPSRSVNDPSGRQIAHRNRRIKNARMKAELGVTLRYPTFREGEAAIEAEEGTVAG